MKIKKPFHIGRAYSNPIYCSYFTSSYSTSELPELLVLPAFCSDVLLALAAEVHYIFSRRFLPPEADEKYKRHEKRFFKDK